ncbi:flagellar hook-associated protein FlgK [Paucidesulfovibrio longus]|uniref:flagellar hook-associated protein FlgK n=1 Tax=Paucidesulfovibrio longus TaxID=889 RepID=UPI0003B3E847|nr:flagellar hook-associated protein FlgK [Paucidesulfovibrio longus]
MLNNIYNIGVTSLSNAQVGVSNASNNIANADTEGYARTQLVTTTSSTVTINGLAAGTGADIVAIQAQIDSFIEAQYLDASSEYEAYTAIYELLSQAESILSTDEDSGLGASLDAFWSAWNDLAEDPSSESAREALLGVSETLVYELRSTSEELDELQRGIEDEIAAQVGEANSLLEQIAELNLAVAADPTDLDALYARNLAVENLAGLMDITVSDGSNGMVAIYTAGGTQLLQDGECNELVYLSSSSTESQTDASTWDGEMSFSGESSEEILMEFVSGGADGTAQFKVSYDGGSTWETDGDGNVLLYTASATDPAVVDGVEIVFSGTGDHAAGDRYTATAKSGLYLTRDGGDSYKTLTPLTDSSGENKSGRISGGSLAGLFIARDDTLASLQDEVDELAEALIWEVNKLHSQGAGLEHQSALSGTCAAGDSSAVLSGSGLEYAERITSGELSLVSYDADGNVLSRQGVTIDPDADTLDDVVAALNAAFGGELAFTVESDGTVSIQTGTADSFEIASDETGLLAALGLNTYFTGSDAGDIALNSAVATDASHVNCQVAETDGTVSSGSNDTATAISELASAEVEVGGNTSTLGDHLSALISGVGSAVASAELKQTYAETSWTYYQEQKQSVSSVNTDEELISLTKYQQQYEAAARIIEAANNMFEIILDMG